MLHEYRRVILGDESLFAPTSFELASPLGEGVIFPLATVLLQHVPLRLLLRR